MFLKFYLALITVVPTKVPKDVMQGCSTTKSSICTIAVYEIHVFVHITYTTKINIREKYEMFTIKINNERLVTQVVTTQNKYSLSI